MEKNVTSQKWTVFAFNRNTNVPLTGDAANITANIKKNAGSSVATNDVNPTELEDGFYEFDLTQAETNADIIRLFPVSSTSNIQVIGVPGVVYTTPPNFSDLGIESGGAISTLNGHTVQTADHTSAITSIQSDTDDIQTRLPASLTGGKMNSDATTVSDKTGYSLASTGLDAIVSTAIGMVEIAKAIMDRVLTGGTHNINDSLGKRIRTLQEFGTYEGGAVFIDTIGGSAGTTSYESGTNLNPVDSITDANTIAGNLTLSKFEILPGSSITFAVSQDNQDFFGNSWTLALGGQSISASHISGATVSGIYTGASRMEFHECFIMAVTIPPCNFKECDMEDIITLPVGDIDFHHCAGHAGFILDYGTTVANTTVLMSNFSGDMVVDNLGQNGTDILSIRGHGKITLNVSCIGGTINWDGHFTFVDNSSGVTINKDDISSDVDDLVTTIGVDGLGLTDLGGMSTGMQAEIQTELTDYDTPTRTEATSDKDEIITQVNANETKIDTIDTVVDGIKAVTDVLPDSGALTTISTDTARLTAARAGALTDWINGGRLDLLLDAIKAVTDLLPDGGALSDLALVLADTNELQTDDVPGLIAALNDLSGANVLTQVNAAFDTAISELSQAIPTATPTMRTGLMLLYMTLRNKVDVTGTTKEIHNDAGTQIATKTLSDDGTTYSEAEMVAGT